VTFDPSNVLGEGVYATVFRIGSVVYKLFRSRPEVPPKQTLEGRRRVYGDQCEAYRVACADTYLANRIAYFHGPAIVTDVLDAEGRTIKDAYLLDCCYAIELLDGEETKFPRNYRAQYPHVDSAIKRFEQHGIDIGDSSVFRICDPDRFKFIDFDRHLVK
jgi:hypothetical protein